MHSYADVIEMKRANIRNHVLIIHSLRASPAFKCECETSSTLSYILFSPVRIEGGVNLDYVPKNMRANNVKTKLVSINLKMKLVSNNKNKTEYPVKQSNSRNFICNVHTFSSESFEL